MPSKFVPALNKRLDARPDRIDLRDREYAPPVVSLPPRFPDDASIKQLLPAFVRAGLILSQGDEGACTGFGLACVVNYLFWRKAHAAAPPRAAKKIEQVSTRMLYHLARFYDEWPGEDYDGSSCRGALKAWNKHGVCSEQFWPYRDRRGRVAFVKPRSGWEVDALQRQLGVYYRIDKSSIVDMQAAIHHIGAVYVSSDVHDGWAVTAPSRRITGHDSLPMIAPIRNPDSLGGHAFALVGYNEHGFVVQNSWDTDWGLNGFATLPYAQWSGYGSDAWVCALGVPGGRDAVATMKTGRPRALLAQTAGLSVTTATKPLVRDVSAAVAPWTADAAYRHTVVMDNDGRVVNRILSQENARSSVRELVVDAPARWFKGKTNAKRVVIYAHGGLNSEQGSIERIRVLAPYFDANGIYPLFLTWKTGAIETLTDLIEDQLQRVPKPDEGIGDVIDRVTDAAAEALDRTIEVVVGPAVKPIWSQMKQNAAAATEQDHGGALIAAALLDLKAGVPDVEIHLIGHSAGSILLGQLIGLLDPQRQTIASCSLYAPACTVPFALDHYLPAVQSGLLAKAALHIHLLSNRRELDDTVGPYQKSLLYLVSRALESDHKMPILGLANVFDPAANDQWHDRVRPAALPRWQTFWGATNPNLYVVDHAQVSTGPKGKRIKASHGCFDNDAATIDATLSRILGATPQYPVESLDY
jgi:hypothetical protein